eukprot:scaffold33951_cov43-Phaeocystis_antarctica.AAC.2
MARCSVVAPYGLASYERVMSCPPSPSPPPASDSAAEARSAERGLCAPTSGATPEMRSPERTVPGRPPIPAACGWITVEPP